MNQKTVTTSVVVGAVIFNDNKVLLLQRSSHEAIYPNLWELPSGKKKPFEHTQDALIREVLEETGLCVTEATPLFIFDYQIEKISEIKDSVQINYSVQVSNPNEVKISAEHQKFVWSTEESLDDYEITSSTRAAIEKGFLFLKNKKAHC